VLRDRPENCGGTGYDSIRRAEQHTEGGPHGDCEKPRLEGSQKRIAENTKILRNQLEELPEERRNTLIAFIIQHCYLVVVAVPTAEAARRIFTVLNARGLDLTPTDILKADLLERAGTTIEGSLANRWEQVEQAFRSRAHGRTVNAEAKMHRFAGAKMHQEC
jgi:Protein of unknown function DUF262